MRESLVGPRGDNLLGYLTAIGVLNVLHRAWPDRAVKLGWERGAGGWQPTVTADGDGNADTILDAISDQLRDTASSPEFTLLGDDLPVSADHFRRTAIEARAGCSEDRRTIDFLAAFGHDAVLEGENIQDTDFRTMSGAGHQHFLLFMRHLAAETTTEHLRAALFQIWTYQDPRPSMRWDASDDRRYALRASDPGNSSRSPILTVRGANRLAIEALPTFPVVPTPFRDHTCGFVRHGASIAFSWPIWAAPLGRDVVRTLVGYEGLTREMPHQAALRILGVVEVYRCQRIKPDKASRFRNFTPASACWGGGNSP